MFELDQGRNVSGRTVTMLTHQRNQTGRRPRLSEEWMMKKLDCTCSLGRISDKHLVQESLQLRRYFGVLQFWRRHVTDPSHGLEWRFVEERRLPVHHFYQHYTQGPNIHIWTVGKSGNNFWSHPIGSSYKRLSLGKIRAHLGAESKV